MADRLDPGRLAGAGEAAQAAFLVDAALEDPMIVAILDRLAALDLPDAALMAGAVYQAAWNRLTGRPGGHGIKDYDVGYYDGSDLSEAGEDIVIRRCAEAFADLPAEVEVRNQARVHIWFSAKFGVERQPLRDTEDALRHFGSLSHGVALRPTRCGTRPAVLAPCGLDEIFSGRIVPRPDHADPAGWNGKMARQKQLWPELDFVLAPVIREN
ncbi:nucleotidyltransferase family protein [uncultured Maricaulis sp.]|uniref:nucleotidyltransferase family protein n=1 Tax=uncultured Maricaulis sp. TaxID=174710 RepID=UPI0030D8A0FC